MKIFIKNLLDSRPRGKFMEYSVEWNDGSIEWVSEGKLKKEADEIE